MIRHIILAAGLLAMATTAANAGDVLFASRALASIRSSHQELARNPILVICNAPDGRTTEFRGELQGLGFNRPGPVVTRVLVDTRCSYPWNIAAGAVPAFSATGVRLR